MKIKGSLSSARIPELRALDMSILSVNKLCKMSGHRYFHFILVNRVVNIKNTIPPIGLTKEQEKATHETR